MSVALLSLFAVYAGPMHPVSLTKGKETSAASPSLSRLEQLEVMTTVSALSAGLSDTMVNMNQDMLENAVNDVDVYRDALTSRRMDVRSVWS